MYAYSACIIWFITVLIFGYAGFVSSHGSLVGTFVGVVLGAIVGCLLGIFGPLVFVLFVISVIIYLVMQFARGCV